MTITIPAWILWTFGIAVGLVVLFFAFLGAWLTWEFRDFKGWG